MADVRFELSRAVVKKTRPNARLEATTLMYVIVDSGQELGRRQTTPEGAWVEARKFLAAS